MKKPKRKGQLKTSKKTPAANQGQDGGGVFYNAPSIVKRRIPVYMTMVNPKKVGGK